MTHEDKTLLNYLEFRKPEHWEVAAATLGEALMKLRSDLIRYVKRFNRLSDPEDYVDEVIVTVFEAYRDQFLGKSVRLPFSDEYHDRVDNLLWGWVCAIIGRPFAGSRSGTITNTIRRQDAEASTENQLEIQLRLDEGVERAEALHFVQDAEATLSALLAKLPPRDEFLFRISTGLHNQAHLSIQNLTTIALTSRLEAASCEAVRERAKRIAFSEEKTSLDQKATATLLGISDRTVRRVLTQTNIHLKTAAKQLA